jgi:hypothetical protein
MLAPRQASGVSISDGDTLGLWEAAERAKPSASAAAIEKTGNLIANLHIKTELKQRTLEGDKPP